MTGRAVVVGENPQFEAWLARRRDHGLDKRDEVWQGVLHLAAPEHGRNGLITAQLIELLAAPTRAAGLVGGGSFNLGGPGDFRVPALGYHRRPVVPAVYMPSAALTVEVVSPGDESSAKLPFYAEHGVDEVWLVDPMTRRIRVHLLRDVTYVESSHSGLIQLRSDRLESQVEWP